MHACMHCQHVNIHDIPNSEEKNTHDLLRGSEFESEI
jgi:hypothetical protein